MKIIYPIMKIATLILLLASMPAASTPIESTCQRDARDRGLTGRQLADYLRQCRSEQGLTAAVNICERLMAGKPIQDGFQKNHIMQLCMLDYLHPGNAPYSPPQQIKPYK